MKVLGISGRYRDAAAALAVDGRLIAAVSEDCFTKVPGIGYQQTGGFPSRAVEACLQGAGLELGDVDELTVVEHEGPAGAETGAGQESYEHLSVRRIDAVHADAVHAAASASGPGAVLVCSTQPPVIAAFVTDRHQVASQTVLPGGDRLMRAARQLAGTLGVPAADPYGALDRLSVGADPEFQADLGSAIAWRDGDGMTIDADGLSRTVRSIAGDYAGSLADATSLNVRLQAKRRALAASFTCRLAQVIRDAAETLVHRGDLDSVVFGGAMFANRRLSSELERLVGDGLALAAVPEPAGRALGAALSTTGGLSEAASGLALGPAFSDVDIKRTLDNCRLDYVYEPDWPRLFERTSRLLAQGKVVAWFQGAMGFGPRAMGTRSILCDPSGRYARHNINEYLRQVPLDEPLPVVFAPSIASQCLTRPVSSRLPVMDAAVTAECRDRLVAALDWRHFVRVHAVGAGQARELCELLECHYQRTQVPALIETNLSGPGEPLACTPRDAVRTVYSSAIDVLVIGRFLLMKDHWLLRSDVG
ncbi:MAG TPA: carbamoyltransferase C-terminal domain-containing protein [Vicinamibacterales bacterium]|jgi:carbamoyltransferase